MAETNDTDGGLTETPGLPEVARSIVLGLLDEVPTAREDLTQEVRRLLVDLPAEEAVHRAGTLVAVLARIAVTLAQQLAVAMEPEISDEELNTRSRAALELLFSRLRVHGERGTPSRFFTTTQEEGTVER